jgi:uncharacterized protein YjiS (DUF1127 family)
MKDYIIANNAILLIGLAKLTRFSGITNSSKKESATVIDQESQRAVPAMNSWRPALNKIVSTLADWKRRIHERQELVTLNDHTLHDIGLNRTNAMEEARKPFWKP